MKKTTILLFVFTLNCNKAFTQVHEDTIKVYCEKDCPKKHVTYKPSLHPFAGIHISGDAEMYYIGPSFQAGVDFQFRPKIILSAYFQYFNKKTDKVEFGGDFEHGRFRTLTGALLIQGNTGKRQDKSFFIAGGVALQRWHDKFSSNYDSWDDKRTTYIPAFRIGYFFPLEQTKITIELNGTGPYFYSEDNYISSVSVTEILTQVSLGMRLIF